jgi:hypothetical protein
LDAGKYIARTNAQIAENKGHAPEEEVVVPVVVENVRPLSETIIESFDKAADNIILWINGPKN